MKTFELDNSDIEIESRSKLSIINRKSQKGLILDYLQKNSDKEVDPVDFINPSIFSRAPFIGYTAPSRLVELKKRGLIKVVGKAGGIKTFFYKSKERQVYKITQEGLLFDLKD